MTSAARPTWSAALGAGGGLRDGSSAAPTLQTCAKDQPGHLKLKLRQVGQDAPEEIIRAKNLNLSIRNETVSLVSGLITGDSDVEIDDSEADSEEDNKTKNSFESGNEEEETINEKDFDDNNENDDDNESEESDDEELELMRELEKIRREREAERIRKEKRAEEEDPHAILAGNPLLAASTSTTSFGVKRRWDDDVVFKNQARGVDEKPQKRFINDTTRSDFHRRFLDKYIK